MECGSCRAELREELAEDELEVDDSGTSWGRHSADEPSPYMVLQYPLLQLTPGAPLSRREAVANMLVNMLGVGVLAMPRAIADAGLLTGGLVLAGVAFATRETLLLLLSLGVHSGHRWPSYPEIGRCVLGPPGLVVVLLLHLLYTGGLLTAHMVALADLLRQTAVDLQGGPDTPRLPFVFLAVAFCALGTAARPPYVPVLLSGACMAGAALLVLSLLAACWGDVLPAWLPGAAEDPAGVAEDVRYATAAPSNLLRACALFTLQLALHAGFVEALGSGGCHTAVSQVAPRPAVDVEAATRAACLAAALLVGSVGTAGHLRFGSSVAGDVLESFGSGYAAAAGVRRGVLLLARAAYGVTLAAASGSVSAPCRAVALELCAARRGAGGATHRAGRKASVAVLGACGLLAWLQRDLAELLIFVGSWAAGPLALGVPGVLAMELARRQEGRPLLSPVNARYLCLVILSGLLLLGHLGETVVYALSQPPGHRGQRITVYDLSNITSLWP